MMYARKTLIFGLLLIGTGCPVNNQTQPDLKVPYVSNRLYYGDCVRLTEEEQAKAAIIPVIAAAVLPSLISNTLDRFGNALRGTGEAQSYPVTTQRNIEVEFEVVDSCMQWVRGRFLNQPPAKPSQHLTGLEADESDRLAELGIYLAEPPDLFIEWRLRASADRTALAVAPTYVEYNRLLKDRSDKPGNTRGLALQLSFHGPGKSPNSATAVGTSVVFGNLTVGSHRRYDMPYSASDGFELESPWFPTFASSRLPKRLTAADPQMSSDSYPMTVTATVAEMRDANQFLLFLADVFDESREDLKAVIDTQLIKEKRDKAELDTLKESQTRLTNYYTEYANAEAKMIEYCSAIMAQTAEGRQERLARSRDAYIAQSEANLSAANAGLPRPYEMLVTVSDALPTCEER